MRDASADLAIAAISSPPTLNTSGTNGSRLVTNTVTTGRGLISHGLAAAVSGRAEFYHAQHPIGVCRNLFVLS